jgi:hypothetical protein
MNKSVCSVQTGIVGNATYKLRGGGDKLKLDSVHKTELQNVPYDLRLRVEHRHFEFSYNKQ